MSRIVRVRFSSRAFGLPALVLAIAVGPIAVARINLRDHASSERSEDAFLKAAQAAAESGDTNSTIAFYRRAADLAPKDATPLVQLGAFMAKTGALPGAVEAYRGALLRAPSDWRIDLELGRLDLRLDHPREAIGHFDTARREHPQASAWNGLGVSRDLLGDHVQAQDAYQEGLKLSPGDPTLRNNLGLSQALAGNFAAAIAGLSSLAAEPGASPRYRLNLALAYGLAGEDDHAATAARRDLGEAEIASNRRYYQTLRALDDHARSQAILGGGTVAGEGP